MLELIHGGGRQVFLRADRVFDRLFGEPLNPLYRLGAIGCYLFAVVVASGFWVYAFYETGVTTTYASIAELGPVGRLMRGVHRYASDALVLVVLLHLARHFFFDRYRGWRAFSWITGMVLLGLIWVSGVNGYMLPWDRLAQYTVIATAEWLDALPVLRGTLVRNFVLPEAITDRFFSLLQFLHIGIPLAALAALWIHVQRVPRARIMPPRGLMLGVAAMLVVLALLRPVFGQGPADPLQLPQQVDIDWFYLTLLPMVDRWGAVPVWWLVAAVSLFVLLLPWLPPRRAGHGWQMTLHPGAHTVPVRGGETLLDAGLRAEQALPFECRAGACGVCRATVLAGTVDDGGDVAVALTAEQRARGEILLCCACATSDVEIEVAAGAARAPLARYRARVVELDRVAPEVMRLVIELQDGATIAWRAGQYLQFVLEDGGRRAFSFTAAGGSDSRIELHVRRVPGGRFTGEVFERMKVGDALELEGPVGDFELGDGADGTPLVFVAGATGFAPVKSLLEEAFRRGLARPLHLYWGVRRPEDLYLRELPERWAREHANFRFVPVVSELQPSDRWRGRTGLVHQAILDDFSSLSGFEVYACGSVRMVETARPAFIAHGLAADACHSDAFGG